jgi:hypothetical protein
MAIKAATPIAAAASVFVFLVMVALLGKCQVQRMHCIAMKDTDLCGIGPAVAPAGFGLLN